MLRVDVSWKLLLGTALGLPLACSRADPASQPSASTAAEMHRSTASQDQAAVGPESDSLKETADPRPPPRRAIAGIPGFQTNSRVVYAAEPEKPHTLSATYLFPERVRMRLAFERGNSIERVILYRFGAQAFVIEKQTAVSRELTGPELEALRLQTELRRALFLWPDGFSWLGAGDERTAALERGGKLIALLGSDGRPVSMQSLDSDSKPAEKLQAIAWKARGVRHFPSHFELLCDERLIATEDVIEVETALNYIEAFFLPPDRRREDRSMAPGLSEAAIRTIDIPAGWELRAELNTTTRPTLDAARASAELECSAWKARGVAVLDETIVELDTEGRPIAALLRATGSGEHPIEGWRRTQDCPAWSIPVKRLQDVDAAHIDWLKQHSPLQATKARAELHWVPRSGGPQAMSLVLRPD